MLSLPENWDYTLSGLRTINKEGKDTIRTSLWELEQAGYLRRSQTKAPNGRFSKNEYVIYELPQKPEPTSEDEPSSYPPEPNSMLYSPPSSEKTAEENPPQIKIDQQSPDLINFDSFAGTEEGESNRRHFSPRVGAVSRGHSREHRL